MAATNGTRRKPTKLFKKFLVLWLIRLLFTLIIFMTGVITGRLHQKPFNLSFHFQAGGAK